jgi:hypothetical protein
MRKEKMTFREQCQVAAAYMLFMPIVILLVVVVALFAGCSTPKKLTTSTGEQSSIQRTDSTYQQKESTLSIDTTLNAADWNTSLHIEFYPDDKDNTDSIGQGNRNPIGESPQNAYNGNRVSQPPNIPAISIDKNGNINLQLTPNVKSIEVQQQGATKEQKGIAEQIQKNDSTGISHADTKTDKQASVSQQTAPDPYRWRYIFGIVALLLIAAYFFLRKAKITGGIVSKIASFIKGLFYTHNKR